VYTSSEVHQPSIPREVIFAEHSGRGVKSTTHPSSVAGKNWWSHTTSRRKPGKFTIALSFPSPVQHVQSAVECKWCQILKPNIRNPSGLGKVNLKSFVCTARRRIEGMAALRWVVSLMFRLVDPWRKSHSKCWIWGWEGPELLQTLFEEDQTKPRPPAPILKLGSARP
jgi:hypothetical protein